MAKNSAVNLDITNNADGFDVSGGTTPRKLTVTGAAITLTGSGTNVYTMPAATDTLVGRASTDTLTSKTITNANNTVSAATFTNPYKFSAYRNSAWTLGANTKVSLDTELYDTGSNFASGTFTAPVAGFYHFSAAVGSEQTAAQGYYCYLYKNNATIVATSGVQISGFSLTFPIVNTVSKTLQLAASDTIELYGVGNAGTNPGKTGQDITFLTGELVSIT
jgi:hypothetical protein